MVRLEHVEANFVLAYAFLVALHACAQHVDRTLSVLSAWTNVKIFGEVKK